MVPVMVVILLLICITSSTSSPDSKGKASFIFHQGGGLSLSPITNAWYIGYSMGGQQAYYMASMYPDFVENMIGLSTSARTSWSNWMSLEGPRYALVTAHDFHNGHYKEPAKNGVKAFKRVQAARALSNGWFRQEAWKQAGFESLDVYLQSSWTDGHDANDLLAMLWT